MTMKYFIQNYRGLPVVTCFQLTDKKQRVRRVGSSEYYKYSLEVAKCFVI
jgi:hypothetical protein